MVSRYNIAKKFRNSWPLLNWKGEKKTEGVYFNDKYGYLIERAYIVRMEHDEPAPPVFYIPKFVEEDDEVKAVFPYEDMETKIKKYNPLFVVEDLTEDSLQALFDLEAEKQQPVEKIDINRIKLESLLQTIPVKRVRDRSYLSIHFTKERMAVFLVSCNKGEWFLRDYFIEEGIFGDADNVAPFTVSVNANTILHALSLYTSCDTITISKFSDRIVVTSNDSESKVEAIISCPKKEIEEEIEKCWAF